MTLAPSFLPLGPAQWTWSYIARKCSLEALPLPLTRYAPIRLPTVADMPKRIGA